MKISEIEEILINGEYPDSSIELFKTALKRVPAGNRCQHCYATAAAMKRSDYKDALFLIEYGLQFCESPTDRMRAYHNAAMIYENIKNFENARNNYINAMNAICAGKESEYLYEYAIHLMRVEMHSSRFSFTEELKKYYTLAVRADGFSRALMKNSFYETVAELIIFMNDKNYVAAKIAYERACELSTTQYKGPLTALLKRHRFEETAGVTEEAAQFLKNLLL